MWAGRSKLSPASGSAVTGRLLHHEVVYLEPGTTRDKQGLKLTGTCPKHGERLAASLA
jgi:hypothetical protein